MREDFYTNTEADAGAYERAHYDDYDDDRPSLADVLDDEFEAPRVTGDPLVNAVNSALIWSGALGGAHWTPGDIVRTAEGVVAFTLTPCDVADHVSTCLAREGFESKVVDGRMFVRRARAGAA